MSSSAAPTIRTEASEARGYVVSIAVNCSGKERGASSVVHVADVGRSSVVSSLQAAMVRPGEFFLFEQPLSSPTDSGTGSDFDGSTPQAKRRHVRGAAGDADEDDDVISCDSLNSSELSELSDTLDSIKLLKIATPPPPVVQVAPYGAAPGRPKRIIEEEAGYDFHINEHDERSAAKFEEDTFAGVRDVLSDRAAIRSAKGTVRGVKNRVRAGIATFLQLEDNKGFKDKEQGKLVVYTTTMGVVRSTYLRCVKVKQILRTLLVKFEERDVFMSRDTQQEIKQRMKTNNVVIPQVFLDGHHIGDVDTIERLNESGELRKLLRPFKCMGVSTPCSACGGYRLLPCGMCNGSKKSVHRNHFTAEFVALKCMTCDESGLMRCHVCS
ncbi:glutaredoxin domain-containing cysteine-rich protein CG31559-like [Neocloeon triangulifer]|uniref:glutaredoxin domain-containing cysteine-rich protein CG31559-like n=1 Tax=Neocloeon triangulifer TaxID=2078957 RepID=UPI00286EDE8E|nr:glutaredoxin domain-containing cysteine-rich protein CG31559-like [Neocloeon triangulifer]